jgi:monoterpene epsilon-lactone hydrolase
MASIPALRLAHTLTHTLTHALALAATCLSASLVLGANASAAAEPASTVHLSATVPVSDYLSPQARDFLKDFAAHGGFPKLGSSIEEVRRSYDDKVAKPLVAAWLQRYPATISPEVIGGVQTDVIVPAGKVSKTRILINLHGGAFMLGARYGGQVESIPLAGIGHVRVVTVDYRQGPEHRFPAASEDVAAVYKALLKDYKAANIGIYGCSAGGLLAAQSVAWFQTHGLPAPGAVGIFCAGAMPIQGVQSDSASVWNSMTLLGASDDGGATSLTGMPREYLRLAGNDNPMAWPGISPEVLAKFPPTLLLTGTRDPWMSNALVTHSRLIRAGVNSELYLQEGLGHAFLNLMPGVPEAEDAWQAAWKFFDKALFW